MEILVFIGAVLLDIVLGEPPGRLHPVVWMGKLIGFLEDHASHSHQRLYGALMVTVTTAPFAAIGAVVAQSTHLLAVVSSIYLLKSTFSITMLSKEAEGVQRCLDEENIKEARVRLKSLVGRDTEGLDSEKVSSAVIESVSENYVDSILAPFFYYALFGLPGALIYRAVNTLDSMVGYKTKRYAELGFVSARLDDLLNYIPARLSSLLLSSAAMSIAPFQSALRDHGATPSPNSGWPMAAIAGALGVRLEKSGAYVLNSKGAPPGPEDISRAIALIRRATGLAVIGIAVLVAIIS